MRVSSYPLSGIQPPKAPPDNRLQFLPFSPQAFEQARQRGVPVLLIIGDVPDTFADPALSLHIRERTVAVHLYPGMRPDVELLCQRAGLLYSGEGALPLCALLLSDGRPFPAHAAASVRICA